MSRADRWWRPTSRRPAVRARSRVYRYNQYDVNLSYDRGIARGTRDTAERYKQRDDYLSRLARAAEEGPEALEQLAREVEERGWWDLPPAPEPADDLTDLAREVGVLDGEEDKALWDSVPDLAEGVVVEIEQWLRDRDRWDEGGSGDDL